MYAVIRAGGKQYRVAPGDVIRVEKLASGPDKIDFADVLAVAGDEGQISKPPSQVRVTGQVIEQGRHDKVLVFHYKRKKQYKKVRGHRQPFTAVRITEIAYDGKTFTAPELPTQASHNEQATGEDKGTRRRGKRAKRDAGDVSTESRE